MALVTSVNGKTGEVFVQSYKYSDEQRELSEMAQALAAFYAKQGDEATYSDEFLVQSLKRTGHRQAGVAKVNGRFYQCAVAERKQVSRQ